MLLNALLERINNLDFNERDKALITAAEITGVVYHKLSGSLTVYIHSVTPFPFDTYRVLKDALSSAFKLDIELVIKADEPMLKLMELHKYLKYYIRTHRNAECLNSAMPSMQDDVLELLFSNENEYLASKELNTQLMDFYEEVGVLLGHIDYTLRIVENVVDERKVELVENKTEDKFLKKKPYRASSNKKEDYAPIQLKDSMIPMENICFEGDVFNVEEQITKNDKMIQTLSVSDGSGAILCKRFEGKMNTREDLGEIKAGNHVKVYGNIQYDNFVKDYVCMPRAIEKIDKPKIVDNAEVKRVELHCHTNMSEMDGVCDINDVISFAFNLGYEGIAITDHAGTQAFAKAHRKATGLLKGSDRKFKVMYGCEMNMVDENLTIIRNGNDHTLDEEEYICFDLETTGLSCSFDHIIEFGAVKIKNQAVIDRKQLFVKPPVPIPYFISEKTNITNDMVKDAKPFNEVIDEILEWIGEDVLVAHNATFDYGFMNEELKRIGREPMKNVVVDTLDFARAIHSDRRSYRLGNIARLYRISYDEEVAHRADYDAEVLADVFLAMVRDAKKLGANTINDLQNLQNDQAFAKMRKNHVIVMAKNQMGIRSLYQLVTISNTKSLALFGKANGKNGEEFLSEPRIFRRVLQENRANLVLGSACFNSEVWECAANRNDEDLAKAISFYDYIELQPLANYSTLVQMNSVPNEERLKQIQMRIIKEAQKQHKPVVATGDVHYLTPDQKLFRDIYIATQGVGGVRHPLYVYNAELRKKMVNPDQHFRTTQEMLDAFSWIEDRDLVEEIVIKNSRKIMDCIEPVQPVQDGTFPPIVTGSDQKLTDICFETAHKVYGEVLPDIVQKRLERELKSIIENGYAVVYYISHLLVKKSNEDGYLVGSRGSVGSSFVATMSGITEVNPLQAHYICPHCQYSEWLEKFDGIDGYDLDDKECPKCHKMMKGNGHNIPFETFLGFKGDKVPDIDLNFSNEYQAKAHAFTKEVFGDEHVFRAGTIGTVAEKTAYGYVTGYCEEMGLENMRKVQKDYLAKHCEGVKRTTGQHPGGIIVVPNTYDAAYFTPVQFPANDPASEWKTTHLDFHDIHDNVLKFDILGHVDPTAMRLLENVSGIDPKTIPMNDPETMSLFSSSEALHL
ncbi:MAG: PolC-type DNA polymerase III, partial [Erysipelotrichaceae bacterium]|nr:PolC-type DNA polymerase III [Erysipelotrichaceae bacterium]